MRKTFGFFGLLLILTLLVMASVFPALAAPVAGPALPVVMNWVLLTMTFILSLALIPILVSNVKRCFGSSGKKTMRKMFSSGLTTVLLIFIFALPALAQTATAPAQPVIIDWFQSNLTYILSLALAVSELLAVTPWFKGNGILDSVIKLLQYLKNKGKPAPDDDGVEDV